MNQHLRRLSAAGLALVIAGCSPRQGAESLVLSDRVERRADIAYGTDARQRLDVYRARTTRTGAPVVVFLYGGRWKYGTKRDYLLVGNALARRGLIVVIPDARQFPSVRFPAWIDDGASAIRWTRDHIARLGGDSARIVVVGHSSGAHTVAMLALDARYLRGAGLARDAVRGFASLAGPVDTTWTAPDVQEIMGPSARWPETYPYNFVDGTSPPLLLLHGTSDHVVTVGNSVRLADRIRERGGCVRLELYKGIGHVQIALALTFPALQLAAAQRDVLEFVNDPRSACR